MVAGGIDQLLACPGLISSAPRRHADSPAASPSIDTGGRQMDYVNLGASGLRVSRVCLGMMSFGNDSDRAWVLDEQAAEPIVRAAVEGGITFFDTADTYSKGASEVATGRLLSKLFTRDEVVLATKVFMPMTPGENGGGLSRKHILSAIDASLERLQMDYVDLYQIHRWDPRTPIEETMEALHDVVRAGKARYIGASSMFAWQFAKAQHLADAHGWTRFVSMQNHYNLIYREEEREMMPLCADQGVGVIPWSPLARGVLAGSRTRSGERRTTRSDSDPFTDYLYAQPTDFDVVERVAEVAGERGVPPAQVALAWLLHKPGVSAPIVGATKPGHLQDAIAAEQLELSDEEIARPGGALRAAPRARARVGRGQRDAARRRDAARGRHARRGAGSAGPQPASAPQGGGAVVHGHAHRPVPDAGDRAWRRAHNPQRRGPGHRRCDPLAQRFPASAGHRGDRGGDA
jgi:aryl-alcohol dehydrogenase-like predicted oxidoreductase